MKILIPITIFGPGGGYRVLSEFANQWIVKGNEVVFLAYKGSNSPYFPTKATVLYYDNNGILSEENDVNYKKPLFRILSVINALKKAINSMEADIVLATLSITALPIYLSNLQAKKVYYIQAYEPEYYHSVNIADSILKFISKLSYQLPFLKIVNAPLYLNYKSIKADHYVFPGIDFSKFYPVVKKTTEESFVVGTIGRLEPHKGTTYVYEAFIELQKKINSPIKLRIAFGQKELAVNNPDIEVVVPKDDAELGEFYRSVDVIVAPGLLQLGAVHYPVIEAMASKTPVITTGYYPATDENAWIVPMKDSKAIADAITDIMTNKQNINLKLEKAYNEISVFDWFQNSQKMLDLFKK
jgi:glycosyltransferase involved in cell wall biosynthesis